MLDCPREEALSLRLFLPHSLLISRKRDCLCSGSPFCYPSKHSSEVSHGKVPNVESFSGTRSLLHSSSIMSKLPRSYSDKYVPGQGEYDLFKNLNAEWITGPFIKVFYIALVAVFAAVLYVSQVFSFEDMWTVTNIAHGVITFIFFHWIKGCPDDSTQGEYNAFTLYEQIDAGTPWTQTKKFLMLMPTLLTYIACQAADYKKFYVIVNLGIFFICIIAKLPQMHRVRILGINSTPGIDNPVQLQQKEKKRK